MTDPTHQRPVPPTAGEIAALLARLRELSTAGRAADPAERAAFIADKHDLLDRIAAQEPERYPAPDTRDVPLSRADAAARLVALGHDPDRAREMVTAYLDDTSQRIGVPVYQWGLDEGDVTAIAEQEARTPVPYELTDAGRAQLDDSSAQRPAFEPADVYTDADLAAIAQAMANGDEAEADRLRASPSGARVPLSIASTDVVLPAPRQPLDEEQRRADLNRWHADDRDGAGTTDPALFRAGAGDGWAD